MLICSPRVSLCGCSIRHPSDARVNIRVQTTGKSGREVLKDACQNLMFMCQQVRSTFMRDVIDFLLPGTYCYFSLYFPFYLPSS
ncbi:uncharacterized protein LOC126683333 [Mercurialis annua]|uniref:uncharacterized protein LOC126665918 n=1 Tax=Mercurialis annua TaxID=3986 RepID=UPI00215E31A3|nr:uncharacterized protein LOC126665918 [Mercurialis annua]XP_050235149.1 uncharacterized protein LOC126683333 [Mercurialis annua]